MRRCLCRVHRFSPGCPGAEMTRRGDLAAECGHWTLFQERHVDPSSVNVKALHAACRSGKCGAVQCLVLCKQDVADYVNWVDEYGWTGLHVAVLHDREDVVRLLVKDLSAVDMMTSGTEGVRASSLNSTLWQRVTGQRGRVGRASEQRSNVVSGVMQDIDANKSEDLLCGRVCDAVREFGREIVTDRVRGAGTILHAAARRGFTALCRACLELGADPQPTNDYGITPLSLASMHGHVLCTKLMLDHGVDVNQSDVDDMNPVFVACMNRQLETARVLLARGANVHYGNVAGWTPLIVACDNGDVECVRLLLDHGASVHQMNKAGGTPLCVACWAGSVECASVCLNSGAEVNHAEKRGWTPLFFAADTSHRAVALLLLRAGADPRLRNALGETAADKASGGREPDLALGAALEAAKRDPEAGIAQIERLLHLR